MDVFICSIECLVRFCLLREFCLKPFSVSEKKFFFFFLRVILETFLFFFSSHSQVVFYVLGDKGLVAVGQGGDAGASEKYCSWIIEINYLHDHHHDQQNHLHDHHHDYENHLHNRHQHYHDHHGYHHGQGGGAGTSE